MTEDEANEAASKLASKIMASINKDNLPAIKSLRALLIVTMAIIMKHPVSEGKRELFAAYVDHMHEQFSLHSNDDGETQH